MFKGYCFPKEIILQAVYFKLKFSLSYRDIEELLSIRGVSADHSTIQRWVYKFTPLMESTFRKRKKSVGSSWRMEETYSKVKGCMKKIRIKQCKYLNNRVEANLCFIKWRTQNMLGFKSFESISRILAGIEMITMIKKEQI